MKTNVDIINLTGRKKKILADRLMRFMRGSRKYFPRWGGGGLMDIAREVYMYDEFYCVNPPDPPPFLYFDMSSGSIPDDTSNSLPEDKMSISATSVFSWI